MRLRFLFAAVFAISLCATAQECQTKTKTIKGIYRGKNLWFQNDAKNGIQKIMLDGKEIVSKFSSNTFELPLSGLKLDKTFELKIIYCTAKKEPFKVLNPEVIK